MVSQVLDKTDDENEEFESNILNSTVYIISMALQISTFAVNYRVSKKLKKLNSPNFKYWLFIKGWTIYGKFTKK